MKYLLVAMLVSYGLSFWAYRATLRPGDDFAAAFFSLVFVAISIILTVVYTAMAFWNHRFL